MERTILRGTGIETSRLGMGCVSLTRHAERAEAVRLLETALAEGITHYDVAPQYGFGQAEGILGQFLKGKRDRVTVATKFGLAPSPALAKHKGLVSMARSLARKSGAFAAVAKRVLKKTGRRSYDPADAAASLETSLRELGTDYVDLFLLHDCSPADAGREDLRRFLEEARKNGKIRAYGVATSFDKLGEDASVYPEEFHVLQFDNAAGEDHVARLRNAGERALITYGATRLAGSALGETKDVASLLVRRALEENAGGVVLFDTTRLEHLRANVESANRGRLTAAEREKLVEALGAIAKGV
jgi:aryl-alcohol dehydrogenase-like predicted oxidoreductase